jgi:hypothetical protein
MVVGRFYHSKPASIAVNMFQDNLVKDKSVPDNRSIEFPPKA